jgi:hypothetical protein
LAVIFDPWLLLLLNCRHSGVLWEALSGASNESAKEVKMFGLGQPQRAILAGTSSVSTRRTGIWRSDRQMMAGGLALVTSVFARTRSIMETTSPAW